MKSNSKQEEKKLQERKEAFHEWLLRMKNVHTANNSKMTKAFARIV